MNFWGFPMFLLRRDLLASHNCVLSPQRKSYGKSEDKLNLH